MTSCPTASALSNQWRTCAPYPVTTELYSGRFEALGSLAMPSVRMSAISSVSIHFQSYVVIRRNVYNGIESFCWYVWFGYTRLRDGGCWEQGTVEVEWLNVQLKTEGFLVSVSKSDKGGQKMRDIGFGSSYLHVYIDGVPGPGRPCQSTQWHARSWSRFMLCTLWLEQWVNMQSAQKSRRNARKHVHTYLGLTILQFK